MSLVAVPPTGVSRLGRLPGGLRPSATGPGGAAPALKRLPGAAAEPHLVAEEVFARYTLSDLKKSSWVPMSQPARAPGQTERQLGLKAVCVRVVPQQVKASPPSRPQGRFRELRSTPAPLQRKVRPAANCGPHAVTSTGSSCWNRTSVPNLNKTGYAGVYFKPEIHCVALILAACQETTTNFIVQCVCVANKSIHPFKAIKRIYYFDFFWYFIIRSSSDLMNFNISAVQIHSFSIVSPN